MHRNFWVGVRGDPNGTEADLCSARRALDNETSLAYFARDDYSTPAGRVVRPLVLGTSYQLRVRVLGTNLRCELDDTLYTRVDLSRNQGHVVLGTGYTNVHIDWIVVYELGS